MTLDLRRLTRAIQRQRRRLVWGLGLLLLGTGVTAVAVAPLSLENPVVPVRQIVQDIAVLNVKRAQQPGYAQPLLLYRSDLTQANDSIDTLLARLGASDDKELANFLRTDVATRGLWRGEPGKVVSTERNSTQAVRRFSARWLDENDHKYFSRLMVERRGSDGSIRSRIEVGPATRSVRVSSGRIQNTFFEATDAAQLPERIANQLADVFSSQIDFRSDLQAGDTFQVIYETFEAHGEVLRHGQLLAAEFVNAGQRHQVVWFQPANGTGAFFTMAGESLQQTFLGSPLNYSRVSSGYGMRFHPIAHRRKAHWGVDFSAPTGTPVHAIGDGTVEFAGWKRDYGNLVVVQHPDDKTTAYAHLSRIHVRKRQRIAQNALLGAVGSTGASTGPHLHFEYLVNGKHQDPLTLTRARVHQPVAEHMLPEFKRQAQAMQTQLEQANNMRLVQARAD